MADHPREQTPVRRGLTRKKIVLFVGLLVLIGASGFLSFAAVNGLVKFPFVSSAPPQDLAATAARAYTAGTTKTGVMSGFDPAHTNWNPYEKVLNTTNVPHLGPLWSYDMGHSYGGSSSPTIANGIIYINSGKFYAFDENCHKTCQPLWSYNMGDAIALTTSPAVANGTVYVASGASGATKLYAFDASCRSSCQPLWSYDMWDDQPVRYSSPTVANGIVYIGLDGFDFEHIAPVGKLYAFDASCHSSCQPLWSYTTNERIDASPAVANGIVYVGTEVGKLYAFDASCRSSCQPLWSYDMGKAFLISPTVANGMVYVSSYGRQLSTANKLYAFDASCRSSCQPLWSYDTGKAIPTSPASANGVVYVASSGAPYSSGKLSAFDASCRSACQPLWSYTMNGRIDAPPTVANGIVYVASWDGTPFNADGKLYAFDASCHSSCQPLWSYTTTSKAIGSSPAVANGVVYVSSGGDWEDAKLYAFGLTVK